MFAQSRPARMHACSRVELPLELPLMRRRRSAAKLLATLPFRSRDDAALWFPRQPIATHEKRAKSWSRVKSSMSGSDS